MSDSNLLSSALWLVIVSLLWGITNPLLKTNSSGIENIRKDNCFSQFFAQLTFLVSRWQYLSAFLANQSGSLLFYLTLVSADLSLAVPIANSLTLVFTAISGCFLLEESISNRSRLGIFSILLGVGLCVTSKIRTRLPF